MLTSALRFFVSTQTAQIRSLSIADLERREVRQPLAGHKRPLASAETWSLDRP